MRNEGLAAGVGHRRSIRSALGRAQTVLQIFALLGAALAISACAPADPLEGIRSQQARGNFQAGLESLRELVATDPSNNEANFLLGLALVRTGHAGSAIWPLRVAVKDPGLAVDAGLVLTEAALQSRFKDEAIQAADAVLAIEPNNVAALEMRIDAYQAAGRNEEVLEEVTRVLELDPDNKKVLVPRIMAHLAMEDEAGAEEALRVAKEGLGKSPDEEENNPGLEAARARLCVVNGMFSFERGDREAADAQYTKCQEEHPLNSLVVQETVAYYDKTGRSEQATEFLQAALVKESKSQFRILLAQRMRRQGKTEEAEQLLREEAEQSSSANAWFVLGDHYVRRDMLDEAVDAFHEAVNVGPEPPPMIVFAYADTLIQANRLEEARIAGKALKGTPLGDLAEGRILAAEGKWTEALETFEKGIRLWPNNPGARLLAGETAEKLGRFDEATSHYREAIRADKSQADSALRLALLQEAQGLDMQALDRIGHYVRASPRDPTGYEISIRLANRVAQREIVRRGLTRLAQLPGSRGLALSISAEMIRRQKGAKESIALIKRSPLDLTEPENSDALESLVRGLVQSNQSEEARDYVLKALEAHPECADFHALQGHLIHRLGADDFPKNQEAAAYRRAIELDSNHGAALMALAKLEVAAERHDEALELYDRASQADSQQPAAAMAALQLLREQASLEERQAHAETYLVRHLHSAGIASELSQIVAQRGEDPERALKLARRAALFDRGERKASQAALQAVAKAGVEPQAATARAALEALKPKDP